MTAGMNQELYFFLNSILMGIFLTFLYDVLRILRRMIPHRGLGIAIEDAIYWVISAIMIFKMMYEKNNGAIRGFSIVGIGIGMLLYTGGVSKFLVKYMTKLFQLIGKALFKVLYILSTPLRFVGRKVYKMLGIGKKKAGKTQNFFLKRLKKAWKEVRISLKSK